MSQMTKKALAASFKRLLEEKPFSKITISDITEACGINRMTFYYHFQDIHDLIEWICAMDASQAIGGKKSYATWQEGFLSLLHYVLDNRVYILNLYRSIEREQIENYLHRVVSDLMVDVVEEQAVGIAVQAEHKKFIAEFYQYAFVGLALNWVKCGMKEPPEQLVEDVSTLMTGAFRSALLNFRADAAPEKNHK